MIFFLSFVDIFEIFHLISYLWYHIYVTKFHIGLMNNEGSTKILKFMIPGIEGFLLHRGNITHLSENFVSDTDQANWVCSD